MDIATSRSSRSVPNNPNSNQIRDDQDNLLNFYKTRHEENKRVYIHFMNNDICNSFPPSVTKTYSRRKRN